LRVGIFWTVMWASKVGESCQVHTVGATTPFEMISHRHVLKISYIASLEGRSINWTMSARSTKALSNDLLVTFED
jgi:hypothetical protein